MGELLLAGVDEAAGAADGLAAGVDPPPESPDPLDDLSPLADSFEPPESFEPESFEPESLEPESFEPESFEPESPDEPLAAALRLSVR